MLRARGCTAYASGMRKHARLLRACMTMLQEKCHEEAVYSLSTCVQAGAYCTRAYFCTFVSEHASIREQALTFACLLAHACVRSNVASAASATYLWHFHTQYGENRVDVASGVCENNAHPIRARYSSALPPSPPISMLRMMRVMFGLRKKRSLLREVASSRMPQL